MPSPLINYDDLTPDYLLPDAAGRNFKLGIGEVCKNLPLDRLPSSLLPKANKVVPPLFLYGFPITREEIKAFATPNDLLVLGGVIPDDDLDEDDDVERTEEYYDNLPSEMEVMPTGGNVIKFITKKYNIRSFRMRFGIVNTLPLLSFVFFLTTNWHLDKISQEEVDKVRQVFEWQQQPKWYACAEYCYWGPIPIPRYCRGWYDLLWSPSLFTWSDFDHQSLSFASRRHL